MKKISMFLVLALAGCVTMDTYKPLTEKPVAANILAECKAYAKDQTDISASDKVSVGMFGILAIPFAKGPKSNTPVYEIVDDCVAEKGYKVTKRPSYAGINIRD